MEKTESLTAEQSQQQLGETGEYFNELQYRSLFETMHEGFALHEVICDAAGEVVDYRYLDINPAFEQLTGLKHETTVGRTVRELLPGIENEWIECFGKVALTGISDERESYVQELDRYYRARAYSPEKGKFAVVFEEVTAQRRAQKQLEESETLYRALFEQSPDGISLTDPADTRPIYFNTAMHRQLGYSREEFAAMKVEDYEEQDTPELIAVRIAALQNTGSTNFESIHRTKQGELRNVLVSLKSVTISDQPRILAIVRDITDGKRFEDKLRASESKHRLLFENAGDAILIHNLEGYFLAVNPVACSSLGYSESEFMSLSLANLDTPEESRHVAERFARLMADGQHTFETAHLRKDGSSLPVEVNARMITWEGQPAVMSICRDITERKRAEEERVFLEKQILHVQKLESLGVLAGGIAHDFNNILMAIIGNADLALMRMNPESPAVDNLRRIEQAAARAADLAKQMLAYSGKGKFVVEHIDLNRLLEEMLHMLEVSISKKVRLRINPYKQLPSVEADATQMRQIVMNLVINASEAIGERSGVVSITTGCMECDRNYLKDVWLDENITPGLYVFLEIADTGCGMDRETLARIFDPFFTTKFTGRGLGMAAVLGIIRGHRGAIKVYSEQGRGSTFKILLPASGKPLELFDAGNLHDDWHGSGTVLLADDEETVRAIGSEMLKELGFKVVVAGDGREAVSLFSETPDVSFAILDLTMPRMDGEECFRELRQLRPDIKVIMSSGFSESEVSQKFSGKGLAGFIQKPYRMSVLKEMIRRCCEGDR